MGYITYTIIAKIPDPQGLRGDMKKIPLNLSFECEEDAKTWIREVGPRTLYPDFEIGFMLHHPKSTEVKQ